MHSKTHIKTGLISLLIRTVVPGLNGPYPETAESQPLHHMHAFRQLSISFLYTDGQISFFSPRDTTVQWGKAAEA